MCQIHKDQRQHCKTSDDYVLLTKMFLFSAQLPDSPARTQSFCLSMGSKRNLQKKLKNFVSLLELIPMFSINFGKSLQKVHSGSTTHKYLFSSPCHLHSGGIYIYIYISRGIYIYLYVRDFKAKTEGLRKLLKMLKTLTPLNQELYQYFMIYNISFVQYCFCFLHMEQVNNININK